MMYAPSGNPASNRACRGLRICRACRQEPLLDPDTAQRLYRSSIRTPTANVEQMLAGLELLAEYLGQTYHLLHSAQPHSDAAGRYQDSSEDTILAHALEYIRINYKSRITVTAHQRKYAVDVNWLTGQVAILD